MARRSKHSYNAVLGRCPMCGRSSEKHGILLVANHRVLRGLGGGTAPEKLEAICEECNAGMEAYSGSLEPGWMGAVMGHKSVHVRLGETLKAFKGDPVDAATLRLIADQADWKKRIRELRHLARLSHFEV